VACAAVLLPYSPLAGTLGFTALPISCIGYVAGATLTYLMLVEAAKQLVLRRHLAAA